MGRFNLRLAECQGAADVVFAIDVSGSIRQERFGLIREFFVSIVENLEVFNDRVRVGALTFSDSATLQFRLNERVSRQDVVQVRGDIVCTASSFLATIVCVSVNRKGRASGIKCTVVY